MKKIIRNKVFLSFLLSLVMSSQVGCSSGKVNCDSCNLSVYLEGDEKCRKNNDNNLVGLDEIYDSYINYFLEYEINYNCSDYFITREEVDSIYREQSSDKGCSFVNNDTIFTLYDKIMKNSFLYLESHPEYDSCFVDDYYFDNLELLEQKVLFKNIFDLVLDEHFKDSSNDIDEDVCRMQDLKILYDNNMQDSSFLGRYDCEENAIYLYRENITKYVDNYFLEKGIIYKNKNSYVYKDFLWRCYYWVLSHEFEHVYHQRCNCRENKRLEGKTLLSYSKFSNDIYYVSILRECSAESIFINFSNENNFLCYDEDFNKVSIGNDDYSYKYEREFESLFMLLALFNENVDIKDYYKSIGDADIDAFLDFFDMRSEDDRYTFYKLLHIVDGLNYRSDLINKYELDRGDIITDLDFVKFKSDIGNGYRAEIFKIVLARLVRYTKNNPDFTLDENLLLFDFIKDKIIDDAYIYDVNWNLVPDVNFANDIVKLEEMYNNFLSDYYNISVFSLASYELKNKISNGRMVLDVVVDGGDISYLDDEWCKVVFNLLDRFSLLKPIVYSSDIISSYDYFVERNSSGVGREYLRLFK